MFLYIDALFLLYRNTGRIRLTKIHWNIFIISKTVLLKENRDTKEIYEGYSICHSKVAVEADETLKTLTKENGRRIIFVVQIVFLWASKKKKMYSFLCL